MPECCLQFWTLTYYTLCKRRSRLAAINLARASAFVCSSRFVVLASFLLKCAATHLSSFCLRALATQRRRSGEFVSPTASLAAWPLLLGRRRGRCTWHTGHGIELRFHVFAQFLTVERRSALDRTRIAKLFELTHRGAA